MRTIEGDLRSPERDVKLDLIAELSSALKQLSNERNRSDLEALNMKESMHRVQLAERDKEIAWKTEHIASLEADVNERNEMIVKLRKAKCDMGKDKRRLEQECKHKEQALRPLLGIIKVLILRYLGEKIMGQRQ
ncbi:hypothetical protein H0H93_012249 [Arthromyces matolae]|nr:hypothetical protein H0H93_012249 [Arthromyces matolae]